MFATLALTLSFSPALANEPTAEVTDVLVGDADALGKRRSGGRSGGQKGGDKGGERGDKGGERRESADGGTAERRDGGDHERADGERGERRESADHAAAERRGDPRPSAPSSAARHHVPDHTPAVRHAPASRHAPAHRADVRARHHAAWVSHHRPYHWYGAWRPGHPHYWYHGVFVYGPPVVVAGGGSGGGSRDEAPKRAVDRAGKFALGVHGGSYLSDFGGGGGYGDAGLGLSVSYRPIEALAFEVAWTYHDATWTADTSRIQQPLQLSAEVFAFPWSRVSPYVLAGVTSTGRNLDQPLAGGKFDTEAPLWGPHGGLGIEFAIGKRVALDFDARVIGYVNKPAEDPSAPGAIQANMGLDFYF